MNVQNAFSKIVDFRTKTRNKNENDKAHRFSREAFNCIGMSYLNNDHTDETVFMQWCKWPNDMSKYTFASCKELNYERLVKIKL